MVKHLKLFTPGPGDVDEEILAEMAQPVIRHYGPEWMEVYRETIGLLRQFFKTQNDIFIVPGAASAVLDMALGNLVEPGQKIIIGINGFFGERLRDIAQAYGMIVVPFTAPLGEPLDPQILRGLLRDHPAAPVVAVVHHETGTTVLNPLRELAAVTHEAGRVIVSDTVSSLGGVEVDVDGWGVDVCISGANKCLEALPGIGFISVGPRGWELVDSRKGTGPGWYLNLKVWRQYSIEWGSWHPTPVTMPTSVVLAALASMRKIMAKGLPAHYEKYTRACKIVRQGLSNLGYEMLVPEVYASPIVTAVKARPEFEVAELVAWLGNQRGIAIGGGLGALSGKIFRIGHLGKAAEREYLVDFFSAMEEFLRCKGIAVPAGAVQASLEL